MAILRVDRMRPDIIIHRRTLNERGDNWLACEFKLHDDLSAPTAVDGEDLINLRRYKREYGYGLALWASIPRFQHVEARAVYAEVSGDEGEQPIVRPLVRRARRL